MVITNTIPKSATKKNQSATLSNRVSFFVLSVLMERYENKVEPASIRAITDVVSITRCSSLLLLKCNDVTTIKHNPNKLADVGKICGDFKLAIFIGFIYYKKLSQR